MSPVVRSAVRKPAAPVAAGLPASRHRPAAAPRPGVARRKGRRVPGARKIRNDLLPDFSRQLAAMMSAGMPIVSCLETLEQQAEHPQFKGVIRELRSRIEGGSAFSEALRHFPSVFDDLYANMVKGGETGGQLAETMARLASFLEASSRLRRKVKSAMMYPTIVFSIAVAIAIVMIVFIVPVFGSMFADFGADLPRPTQMLLNVSSGLRRYGLFVLAGIVVAVVLFRKWRATDRGGYLVDELRLKAPVFGDLSRKVASTRFARTFGQLLRSGVPILNAIEISAGATGNRVFMSVLAHARLQLERGESLSSAMSNQSAFPVMLVRMLQAGEKSGKLDDMLDSVADYYDDEVQTMLAGLTSLLEPLLMIFLGVTIGSIVLCMFMPIFKMSEIVSG